jgi:hypothetical protein
MPTTTTQPENNDLNTIQEEPPVQSSDPTEPASKNPPNRSKQKSGKNILVEAVRYLPRWARFVVLSVLAVVFVAGFIGIAYLCWFVWLPQLWNWGFQPLSFRAVLSVLGAIYLLIIPFMPVYWVRDTFSGILDLFGEDAKAEASEQLLLMEEKQETAERIFSQKDTEGLLPLVNYSRIELKQYYLIGIEQAQKSYNNSIIAMWVGFVIIIFGIVSYILPFSLVNEDLRGGNFQILTIGSGVVIELVSALFLFIFRSSTNQLTYFYNRQIFIHNALLSYKMATSMSDPDVAKKMIIEKILDFGSTAKVSATPLQGKPKLEKGGGGRRAGKRFRVQKGIDNLSPFSRAAAA